MEHPNQKKQLIPATWRMCSHCRKVRKLLRYHRMAAAQAPAVHVWTPFLFLFLNFFAFLSCIHTHSNDKNQLFQCYMRSAKKDQESWFNIYLRKISFAKSHQGKVRIPCHAALQKGYLVTLPTCNSSEPIVGRTIRPVVPRSKLKPEENHKFNLDA